MKTERKYTKTQRKNSIVYRFRDLMEKERRVKDAPFSHLHPFLFAKMRFRKLSFFCGFTCTASFYPADISNMHPSRDKMPLLGRRSNMEKGKFVLLAMVLFFGFSIITSPVSKAAEPETTIHILSNPFGSSGYVLSFALADMINKNSSWLRATALETKSSTVNVRTVAEDPEKRKDYLVFTSAYTNLDAARAKPPFKKPYKGLRWVGKTIVVGATFISSNAGIRKPQDMIGKRVALGAKGSTVDLGPSAVLEAWGIKDKVKLSYLPWAAGKTAFLDGTVDVSILSAIDIGGGKFSPPPAGAEIMASPKPVYFIDADEETCKKARDISGYPIYPVPVPAGALGPKQPEPIVIQSQVIAWYADLAMPEKVVYEISRIMWENAGQFAEKHITGRGITRENIHMVPGLTEADMHPGALKFAKEKGLKIGMK
jgi:TRAP transporter TAXI family solute receptor